MTLKDLNEYCREHKIPSSAILVSYWDLEQITNAQSINATTPSKDEVELLFLSSSEIGLNKGLVIEALIKLASS